MSTIHRLLVVLSLLFLGTGCVTPINESSPTVINTPGSVATSTNLVTPLMTPTAVSPYVPDNLVSLDSLLAYLELLTTIHPYSGWRNSGSSGEAQALDVVAGKLGNFSTLQSRGLELERQVYDVYLSTEIRDTRLTLQVNGQEIEVPANGLRGSRSDRRVASYFDSDGRLNDSISDPLTAAGSALVVRNEDALYSLTVDELARQILFIDYSLIDVVTNSDSSSNYSRLVDMIDGGLAGVVLVTQYSNEDGKSRGLLVGDGGYFRLDVPSRRVPILYARIEDLSPAGIVSWDDFQKIEAAQLMLDADVYCPGKAGNLIARIPGADSSKAVILGAHIDSPNSPGAFDDGSGSASLLEVARVMDVSQILPAVDVYLAWFGGHEIGTFGSAYFASTHQELLDRTLALFQMDGLGHPLDENISHITMFSTTYGRFGDERQLLPDFLSNVVAAQGISLDRYVEYGLIADNSNFDAFNVPNVYLGYVNSRDYEMRGSEYFHYANHFHDPYETVDLAHEVGDAFVGMTKVMLSAALETGRLQPDLRVAPAGNRRALFVASHNESVSMTTAMLREFGMALAWEGFDVDLIPCGQAITPSDLDNVGILALAPTLDYPGNYETWNEKEISLLTSYVANGGFLVVTNSEHNFITVRPVDKHNEDDRALNSLLEPMGIMFRVGGGIYDPNSDIAQAVSGHPLTENATYLSFYNDNGVPFSIGNGLELFRAAGLPIVGLVEYGGHGGQVLVVADLGILQADRNFVKNLDFLKNIAHYAKTRQNP